MAYDMYGKGIQKSRFIINLMTNKTIVFMETGQLETSKLTENSYP